MTFTLRRFIRTKSTKNIKSIKSTKRQTSDFFLLLKCVLHTKSTKNAIKRISDYFSLRCFLRAFFIFVRLLNAFVLFVLVKSFAKKKKKFKTALITSFILLLLIKLKSRLILVILKNSAIKLLT